MPDLDYKSPQPWSMRPRFSPKQKLSALQLNSLVDDQLKRSALLTRALHGHGVVFGLEVTQRSADALYISCGLAIDPHGRMLHTPSARIRAWELAGTRPHCDGMYTLIAHYAERGSPTGGCGPCGDEPDWIEQGIVYSLSPGCREADCDCPDIADDTCPTLDDYVCERTGSHKGHIPPAPDLEWACRRLGGLCDGPCGWSYDKDSGIPLACIEVFLRDGDCDPKFRFGEDPPKNCSVRPYVYRTPLLYELIRQCDVDLPWIETLSWSDWIINSENNPVPWTLEVPWDEVQARFVDPNGFIITFTKPIKVATLHPGSIFLTAYTWRNDTDYWQPQLIPIDVEPGEGDGAVTREVRLVIYEEWLRNEIEGGRSPLFFGANIELTIRGQMLRDHCGNMLDARLIEFSPTGRAQNRPGGDFVAMFRTAPKEGYGIRSLHGGRRQIILAGSAESAANPAPQGTEDRS